MSNNYSERLLCLDLDRVDSNSLAYAKEILAQPGVEKMVLLPDAFTKDKYIDLGYKITIPSSSAIVTDVDTLYPQFRSRGINCGMQAVALPCTKDELQEEHIVALLRALTYDPIYYALYRLRLGWYPQKYDLSAEEFIKVLEGGVTPLLNKYNYDASVVAGYDYQGTCESVQLKDIIHLLNPTWLNERTVRMRHSFGRYFGGNHFFELQVADQDVPELSIKRDQVIALFHTGCQGIEPVIRPDLSQKYIKSETYQAAGADSEMYEAFFAAQSILMNLVFAYRLTTFAIVDDVLTRHGFSGSFPVLDKCHNFVNREKINGKDKLVYRHNAEQLQNGEYAIVSGMYDTPSFLVRGDTAIHTTCHTIDHGLGKVIDCFSADLREISKSTTQYWFGKGIYNRKQVRSVVHRSSEAVDYYFSLMQEKQLVSPVVTMHPFLNMKYTQSWNPLKS